MEHLNVNGGKYFVKTFKIAASILFIYCAVHLLYSSTVMNKLHWNRQAFKAVESEHDAAKLPSKKSTCTESNDKINMKQRTELVKLRCASMKNGNLTEKDFPARPLISDHYKLMGCKVDKIASTNLQRIFFILNNLTNTTETGKVNTHAARHQTNEYFVNHNKNKEELFRRLETYTTFMFVRHPLERLMSAYRDFKPSGYFSTLRGGKRDPDFGEYIDYTLEHRTHLGKPNAPIHQMCKPCAIQYDYIGSLDDFDNDIAEILGHVGAARAVTIPQRNETGYKQSKSSSVFERFYKDIPVDKIKELEKVYETDYILFGFPRFGY